MSTYKPTVIIAGRENQLDDPDGLDVAHLANVDYVDFDITYANGSSEGRLQWNTNDGTLEVGMPGGNVNLQIGQELLNRARNQTGNMIPNGTVVYPTGSSGNRLLIDIASNNSGNFPSNQPFAMATENIAHNSDGYVTVFGNVRDIDTDSWNEGDLLYLGVDGGLTDTPPDAPAVTALCAAVVRKHATEGVVTFRWGNGYALNTLADVYAPFGGSADGDTIGWVTANNRYELYNPGSPGPYTKAAFYNGTFRESFDFTLSSNGTVITGTLEQSGGGDLIMQFSDGETVLDCTPAQTINITPGTDSSPIGYMVYIPQDTKTLTISTEWPAFTQHIKVAYILVPSAQYVLDHLGGYVNQNWNDHLSTGGTTANDQGHLAHIGVRIRQAGADWYSGVSPDGADDSYFTINTGNVYFQSTAGIVSQFHPHTYTAKDTSGTDLVIVVNDPDTTYNHVQNLYTSITKDSTGNTIQNNRYFNLVFWGVANKTGDGDWVMANLPGGVYTIESNATNDDSNYDNYNFPREFDIESGTAFLICRVTFKMGATGWTWVQTEDLRGLSPNKAAGGTGTNDHGSLGGLADDDHTQYSLVDGTRDFTGNVAVQGVVNAQAYDTGNYRIDESGTNLQFMNQLDSGDTNFDFMADKNGGDGEDDNFLTIWATGGIVSEYLKIGYESDSSPQRYMFETTAVGGGTHHPIYFAHSGSDVMTIDSSGLTLLVGHGLTLNSGNITSTSGDITLTSGDVTIVSGDITLNTGNVAIVSGDVTLNSGNVVLNGSSGITLNSGDITSNSGDVTLNTGNVTLNTGNVAVTDGDITVDGYPVTRRLNANINLYLSTTGNDSNGGYSSGDAFLTPTRVMTELYKYTLGNHIINVQVSEGTFNHTVAIDPGHPEGARIAWIGTSANYTNQTINNIDASPSALATGLEYIDFDITLPAGSGASTGHYIFVRTTSGGTNPNLVKGCHKIVAYSANVATVRCARTDGVTTMPSGTITANTLTLVKTVFSCSSSAGIYSARSLHCCNWDKMVFEGDGSTTAVWMLRRSIITLGASFGTSNWHTNLNCQYNSSITADGSFHAYSHAYLVSVNSEGNVALRNGSIFNGGRSVAMRAYDFSLLNFQNGELYCGAHPYAIQAFRGGYVTAIDANIEGTQATGSVAFYVSSGGGLDSSGATDDAATSRDQEAAPGGNGSYHTY
jgi:lipopolysaccharide export system protein LptA